VRCIGCEGLRGGGGEECGREDEGSEGVVGGGG